MTDDSVDLIIDLEKPEDQLIEDLVGLLTKSEEKLKKEGQTNLNFLIKKKGKDPKPYSYKLNQEDMLKAENDYVFPKVVGEVIKKEFNSKVAQNEKLLNHIIGDLKKDPYWSNRVTKIIKSLKEGN